MELRSDFKRINNLLDTDTEDITHIELSEDVVTGGKNDSDITESRAPRHRGRDLDTEYSEEYVEQSGGGNGEESLDYLDDYSSAQYNYKSKDLDTYEKEFKMIFDRAREYRKRIMNFQQRMEGGKPEEQKPKKKREPPKALNFYIEMAKTLRKTVSDKRIKHKDFMKISKMIIDDVKKKIGTTELTDKVKENALRIAENPGEYVKRFLSTISSKASTGGGNIMYGGWENDDIGNSNEIDERSDYGLTEYLNNTETKGGRMLYNRTIIH